MLENSATSLKPMPAHSQLWPLFRQVLFKFDPELMHECAIKFLSLTSSFLAKDQVISPLARDPIFRRTLLGLNFPNPVGLAAGFDVDGACLPALQYLGFGFVEVGGITMLPQPGNLHRPRIIRLPRDEAMINQLNFDNGGAKKLKRNLAKWRNKGVLTIPIGINLGKSNFSELADLPTEYAATFQFISDVADYITINISCPNTPGLSCFQSAINLKPLLDAVCNVNEMAAKKVPILLKLGPDLTNEEALAVAQSAVEYGLSGLVVSNTSKKREGLKNPCSILEGGLSGRPLFERSTEMLRCLSAGYGHKLLLIGSGGIADESLAVAKYRAGARLLQIYTGLIYQGPKFPIKLLENLKEPFLDPSS
jgi:dihydroorotate dehydrogenase